MSLSLSLSLSVNFYLFLSQSYHFATFFFHRYATEKNADKFCDNRPVNTIVLTYNPMAGAISCSLDTANDLDTDDERSKIHKDIFEGSRLILLCVCISFPLSFYLTISFFFWGFGKIAPENHSDTPRPVHFHIGIKAVAGLILRSVDKKISKHKKKRRGMVS